MATAQEIISFVKHRRGKLCDLRRRQGGPELATPAGLCHEGIAVADQFGGHAFWSEEARDAYDSPFPGHSLAVVPTRDPAGLVVDFTHPETIIIGQVPDVDDEESIAVTLEEITGYGGWVR